MSKIQCYENLKNAIKTLVCIFETHIAACDEDAFQKKPIDDSFLDGTKVAVQNMMVLLDSATNTESIEDKYTIIKLSEMSLPKDPYEQYFVLSGLLKSYINVFKIFILSSDQLHQEKVNDKNVYNCIITLNNYLVALSDSFARVCQGTNGDIDPL